MLRWRFRRFARRTMLTIVLVICLVVTILTLDQAAKHRPAGKPPSPGWGATGIHISRTQHGDEVLRVAADETVSSRVRVGIFRLGFAERLFVRNAVIDVLDEPRSRRRRT